MRRSTLAYLLLVLTVFMWMGGNIFLFQKSVQAPVTGWYTEEKVYVTGSNSVYQIKVFWRFSDGNNRALDNIRDTGVQSAPYLVCYTYGNGSSFPFIKKNYDRFLWPFIQHLTDYIPDWAMC